MNWWLPWRAEYPPGAWRDDLLAGLMVTVLIVPQSLAYALLAGLPPYTGLIASVLPAVCYGFLGRSSVLAVGPVAVGPVGCWWVGCWWVRTVLPARRTRARACSS